MDIIIFGISGNLAGRKIIPSLLHLHKEGKIPKNSRLIGFSRSAKHFDLPFEYVYVQGEYQDPTAFNRLKEMLRKDARQLFYLALPPEASKHALSALHENELVTKHDSSEMRQILIEKPFGTGYEDAMHLSNFINKNFAPNQCLKVDHYLGKKELREYPAETTEEIKEIICEMLEVSTVEHRKGFYDAVGELRDVGQNHLLYMLATVLKGKNRREEILKHLAAVPDPSAYEFGRYQGSEGKETFFSIPASIAMPELKHIKIVLRAGKGMAGNRSGFSIRYKNGARKDVALQSGVDAYAYVFLDAMQGRCERFPTDNEVLSAWKFIEEVEAIRDSQSQIIWYPIGYDQRFFNEENA